MELPRFIAVKALMEDKYLRYVPEDIQGKHGFVKFSGDEVMSPYSKFEVERARNGSGLVHLRCCYNNKYLVRTESCWWIHAAAEEPNEDRSHWSCTLFKPEPVYGRSHPAGCVYRFLHIQQNGYVSTLNSSIAHKIGFPNLESCLLVWGSEYRDMALLIGGHLECECAVVNWETLSVLPKYVAFKGDNGRYLSARWIQRHEYLQFASTDKRDPTVAHEVFTTADGQIRIRSNHFGKFWRRSPNWIWADTNDRSSYNPDTLFSVVKLGDNVIALQNLGNKNFCKSLTTERKVNCLNAAVSTIPREARLQVEELVLSRSIYNVNFRIKDANIYGERIVNKTTQVATNNTQHPNKAQISFSYTETKRSTWNSSVSWKLGVQATIKTAIPFISEGNISISMESEGAFTWGETKETRDTVTTLYEIQVPPMSKVIVDLIVAVGSCDVPFSYTQRDTLYNGQQVCHDMEDGVYTGVKSYVAKGESREEKLYK